MAYIVKRKDDDTLTHYGTKGMKWGVINEQEYIPVKKPSQTKDDNVVNDSRNGQSSAETQERINNALNRLEKVTDPKPMNEKAKENVASKQVGNTDEQKKQLEKQQSFLRSVENDIDTSLGKKEYERKMAEKEAEEKRKQKAEEKQKQEEYLADLRAPAELEAKMRNEQKFSNRIKKFAKKISDFIKKLLS